MYVIVHMHILSRLDMHENVTTKQIFTVLSDSASLNLMRTAYAGKLTSTNYVGKITKKNL
jgi:hypothetical protein